MSTPPLRLGIVGCGRLAELGYLPALDGVRGFDLVAVADPDAERRQLVGRLAQARGTTPATFADAAALLDGVNVDAVVLASPAAAHLADADRAVAAGVAVLVEKPPAPDAARAAELARLGGLVRVGFNRRFDPAAARMGDRCRAVTTAGGGLDLHLEIAYRRAGWGAHQVADEVLVDLGPHLVDWARWLTGAEVVRVAAPVLGPDRVRLDLALVGAGRPGRATLVALADGIHTEAIEVRDDRGRLQGRHRLGGPVAAVLGRVPRPGRPPHPLVSGLAAQLAELAATVSESRSRPTVARPVRLGSTADGVAVMAVVDAARTSAAQGGGPVAVVPPPERSRC